MVAEVLLSSEERVLVRGVGYAVGTGSHGLHCMRMDETEMKLTFNEKESQRWMPHWEVDNGEVCDDG